MPVLVNQPARVARLPRAVRGELLQGVVPSCQPPALLVTSTHHRRRSARSLIGVMLPSRIQAPLPASSFPPGHGGPGFAPAPWHEDTWR